jgi:hypothetical protein
MCTSHSTELTESAESSFGPVHFVHSVKNGGFRFPLSAFRFTRVCQPLPATPPRGALKQKYMPVAVAVVTIKP